MRYVVWQRPPTVIGGRAHRTYSYKHNPASYFEYGRRMRMGFSFQVTTMCAENADLIRKFRAGDYDRQRDVFESDTTAFCDSVLESIQQFDGQAVPDVLEESHAKISNCHRLCYESVRGLREAYDAPAPERTVLIKESQKKALEALSTGKAGLKLHNEIWARTAQ